MIFHITITEKKYKGSIRGQDHYQIYQMSTCCHENFYLHVNEKWLSDPLNQIPNDYPKWGGFIKLHDQGAKDQIQLIKDLIDNQKSDSLSEEQSKIVAIWKASEQRFNDWKQGKGTYRSLIDELYTLDTYLPSTRSNESHLDIAGYLYHTQINGIQNVFDFDKGQNLLASDQVVLDISTSGLSLPSREYYTDDNFKEKREMFIKHLEATKDLIDQRLPLVKTAISCVGSGTLSEKFVTDVVEFESMIAFYKMKKDQARRYDEYWTNTTLGELYTNINTLASLPEKQENYDESERNYLIPDDKIQVIGEFFEKVYELFDFRRIMKDNKLRSWTHDNENMGPNDQHITAFDGDAIRRTLGLILNPENYQKYRSYFRSESVGRSARTKT
jgi:predicted metalloendopeptidase